VAGDVSMSKELIGAVTYAKGFSASGVRAGIKESGEDIALIVSEVPASAAGLFTTNLIKAAPVNVSQARLPRSGGRAIVANSGNANACTGEQGMADAQKMTSLVSSLLGVDDNDVLVASTGVIGHMLPMDKIASGIEKAVNALSPDGGMSALRGIMTTDTRPKESWASVEINGVEVRIGGIAKGAGMIDPNVATMLSFITTDAAITPELLDLAIRKSADVSYNCLTVDGDTSTNDTVIILANGMSGCRMIDRENSDFEIFSKALDTVTIDLAKQIAADGEGATKIVEVEVVGARSADDCKKIAKTIANSPLVKTALYGSDPNWGRVLAAAGRAGVAFDPNSVDLLFGQIKLVESGAPVPFDQAAANKYLQGQEIIIRVKVGDGPDSARVWTCDFSYDYVKINAEYHT